MSDHEFEKQVQRKLDELKLRPSTAVWTEVEKNIRHAKRRRRFIFWLPVFFLFLATSGYVLYTYNQPSTPIAKATHHAPATATKQSAETTQPNQPVQSTNQVQQTQTAQPDQVAASTPSVQSTTSHSSNDQLTHTENNSTPVSSVKDKATTSRTITLIKKQRSIPKPKRSKNKIYTVPAPQQSDIALPQEEEAPFIAQPQIAPTENNIATWQAVPDSLAGQPTNVLTPEKQNTTAALPVPPIQKQNGPKWQWGIQANAGYSRISQSNLFELKGLFGSTEKNLVEDLARNASPSGATAFSGQYIRPDPPAEKKAAPIQSDMAWSAGIYIQRPLSKRLRLTIGLQYSYMSAHTTIGKLVKKSALVNQGTSSATIVDKYYTSADFRDSTQPGLSNQAVVPDTNIAQKYTYRFHAIELPVLLNWQINKGRRLPPITLDAGFSILHLMSFDALHYDGIKNIYYKEDKLINTTQLNALLGLNVGLFQQSKLPVWIGPSLRYSLTGLVKKEVSKGQFLWSTGINIRIGLNRL